MPILKTCRSCVRSPDCSRRRALVDAVRGHGVGAIAHRCGEHEALFRPGQAVWVHINDTPWKDYDNEGDGGPTRDWFPGTFLAVAKPNTRGTVVVRNGVEGESGKTIFYPITDNPVAFCKVPWRRIKAREAADAELCPRCDEPFRVIGRCSGDPDFCPVKAHLSDGGTHE